MRCKRACFHAAAGLDSPYRRRFVSADAQTAWNAAYCHCPGTQSYYAVRTHAACLLLAKRPPKSSYAVFCAASLAPRFAELDAERLSANPRGLRRDRHHRRRVPSTNARRTECASASSHGGDAGMGICRTSEPLYRRGASCSALLACGVKLCALALMQPVCCQVSCKFSVDASAVTQLALRWSADPTFPAASTTVIGPYPASAFAGSGINAGSFVASDTSSSGRLVYYSVLGNAASVNGTWSAAFATADGIGALFAAPNGAAAPSCGTFNAPCGAIADVLAAPSSPILLLPGNFSGPGNCGLNMAGKVRFAISFAARIASR